MRTSCVWEWSCACELEVGVFPVRTTLPQPHSDASGVVCLNGRWRQAKEVITSFPASSTAHAADERPIHWWGHRLCQCFPFASPHCISGSLFVPRKWRQSFDNLSVCIHLLQYVNLQCNGVIMGSNWTWAAWCFPCIRLRRHPQGYAYGSPSTLLRDHLIGFNL